MNGKLRVTKMPNANIAIAVGSYAESLNIVALVICSKRSSQLPRIA